MSRTLLLLAIYNGLASTLPVAQQQNCGNSQCNQNNFGGVFPAVGFPGAGFPIATGFPVVGATQTCVGSTCNQNNGRKKREDNSAAFAAHAAAEDAIRAKIGAPSLALVAHAFAEDAVRAQQAQNNGRKKREDNSAAFAAHAAAEDAIRAKIGAPSLALVAHAAAEAAVRAQQAQGPGFVGLVGPSGNIGPSGLCGPSGCLAF